MTYPEDRIYDLEREAANYEAGIINLEREADRETERANRLQRQLAEANVEIARLKALLHAAADPHG